MASSQKLGIEIYVDDYHSITVFTATKVEEDEGWKSGFRAKQFDEFCRSHFRAQHFGPDPETGQVGVTQNVLSSIRPKVNVY